MNIETIKQISERLAEEAAKEFKETINNYTEELIEETKNTEPIIKDVEIGNITFQQTNPYTLFIDVTFRLDGETFEIEKDNYQFGKGLDYIFQTIRNLNNTFKETEEISNCSISEIKYIGLDSNNPSRNFYLDKFKNETIVDIHIILATQISNYQYENNWGEQIQNSLTRLHEELYNLIMEE